MKQLIGKIASAFTLGSLAVTLLTGRLLNRYGENRVIQSCVLGDGHSASSEVVDPSRRVDDCGGISERCFHRGMDGFGSAVPYAKHRTRNANLGVQPQLRLFHRDGRAGRIDRGSCIPRFVSLGWSSRVHRVFQPSSVCCWPAPASVLLGFFGLLFLKERGTLSKKPQTSVPFVNSTVALIKSRRFVLQLLTALVLWSFFVGSFPPFFNVYFHKQFNQSLDGIGIIFSVSQLCQLAAVLSMPWLVLRLGRVRAIASVQFASALVLPILIVVTSVQTAGVIYLTYLSLQVMAEPALESFIMDSVLPEERNTVASLRYMTLFSVQALAVLASGFAIARFGYSSLLVAIALLGIAASAVFYCFFQLSGKSPVTHESSVPATCPLH